MQADAFSLSLSSSLHLSQRLAAADVALIEILSIHLLAKCRMERRSDDDDDDDSMSVYV